MAKFPQIPGSWRALFSCPATPRHMLAAWELLGMARIRNKTRQRADLARALDVALSGCDQWTVVKPTRRAVSVPSDCDPVALYADLGSAVWEPSGRPATSAGRP